MVEGEKRIYKGEVSTEETKRLENFRYPDLVSEKYIPKDLTGQDFLDLGSGPNKTLEQLISDRHGFYIAGDKNLQFLKQRQGGHTAQVDATNLPFHDKTIDYAHSRFVMMHLTHEERENAIKEMSRVAKNNISLEYDWGSWEKRIQEAEKNSKNDTMIKLQRRFFDNAIEFFKTVNAEPNMGAMMGKEIEESLGVAPVTERIIRPDGDYYSELVETGSAIPSMWKKFNREDKAKEMEEIVEEIRKLSTEERLPFSPPDIVVNTF